MYYLCMSKGSTLVLPFFSFQSTNRPPNPLKGAFHPCFGI